MNVFLTGGSGLVGRRVLAHLLQQGHRVHALARSAAAAQRVREAGAMVVASLALYRRAAAQGVRRFIYISSESVMQGRGELLDIDASQLYADPPNSDYGKAKKAAEIALREAFAQAPACELIILRPAFVWSRQAPAVQGIRQRVRQGQFMWIDHGRRPFEAVHVDNVARAVACALQRGQPGHVYLVTDGRPWTARELLGPLLRAGPDGMQVPEHSFPSAVARPLAAVVEALWRALDRWENAPPISRFDVAFLSQGRRYRIQETVSDLGYRPVSYVPGTDDAPA